LPHIANELDAVDIFDGERFERLDVLIEQHIRSADRLWLPLDAIDEA